MRLYGVKIIKQHLERDAAKGCAKEAKPTITII